MELLAGPAASVREAKRLVQAGSDGVVAGTGCDVGGDVEAPKAVALGRGEAEMAGERRVDGGGWRVDGMHMCVLIDKGFVLGACWVVIRHCI